MGATEERPSPQLSSKGEGAFSALTAAALALPILVVPARAGAAETGELGFALLGYKERGLIKITEPILWARATLAEVWEVQASAAVDIVTGASPELVTNITGTPVQTITGASISDRRKTGDVKVSRRFGEFTLGASRAISKEEDYRSHAYGIEARLDLDQRNTTLVAGFGKSNDRVGSAIKLDLDERRDTREYLIGVTRVLSPLDLIQSTVTAARGKGWYNDPYKLTLTFYPDNSLPAFVADTRPDHRDTLAWLTRYRRHFPSSGATLQADYRFYRDDWGIRAHTLDVAWQKTMNESWSLRAGIRYYTQEAADFYSPLVPRPLPEVHSSDQRLASFGGLSPSLRAIYTHAGGMRVEGTLGYVYNAASLHLGGGKSDAFATLRAWYGIVSITHPF